MSGLPTCKRASTSPTMVRQLDLRGAKHENLPSEPNIITEAARIADLHARDEGTVARGSPSSVQINEQDDDDDISALLQELHYGNEKLSDHLSELQEFIDSPVKNFDDCKLQYEQQQQGRNQQQQGRDQQQQECFQQQQDYFPQHQEQHKLAGEHNIHLSQEHNSSLSQEYRNTAMEDCEGQNNDLSSLHKQQQEEGNSALREKKQKRNPKLTVRVSEPNPHPSQVQQCSSPLLSSPVYGCCNSNGKSPDVCYVKPSFSPFRDKCTLQNATPVAISPYRTSIAQITPPFSRQPITTPPLQEKEPLWVDFSKDQVEMLLNETMARMRTQLDVLSLSVEGEGSPEATVVALGGPELAAKRKLFTA